MLNDWRVYTDATGTEEKHVAWHEALKAIAQLNGKDHTLVHAAYGDHVDLVVAGGNNGKVLVQWKEHDPQRHFVLATDEMTAVMASLTIEQEDVPFPASWCVPLEQVIAVCGDVLRTCDKGEPAGLKWLPIEA
ncbi:hypothetical protein ACAF76_005005 [Brevibacillus sp. TJ4]|uniref:hypothetical protein n=1 Tax=Brevibacillus sp. TJ4 TaxID=3234853 RepID=UPI0037D37564